MPPPQIYSVAPRSGSKTAGERGRGARKAAAGLAGLPPVNKAVTAGERRGLGSPPATGVGLVVEDGVKLSAEDPLVVGVPLVGRQAVDWDLAA